MAIDAPAAVDPTAVHLVQDKLVVTGHLCAVHLGRDQDRSVIPDQDVATHEHAVLVRKALRAVIQVGGQVPGKPNLGRSGGP